MITEDYVSFEIAKLLKEKEFDEECLGAYSTGDKELSISSECPYSNDLNDDMFIAAPTLQMTMKWLKEIYNIFISISITYIVEHKKPTYLWIPCVIKQDYIDYPTMEEYMADSYEEAVEEAIKYCLNNLI